MSDSSSIEWTDATWNPVRGCSRVSEGCRFCYAEAVASRFSGPGLPYDGLAANGKWTGRVQLVEKHLADPLRWRKPRRIFVNSMSDLFHESLPDEVIAAVFGVMAAARQHTFQVLTKRPERMREWFRWAADTMPSRAGATQPQERINDAAHLIMGGRAPGMRSMLDATWPLTNVWLGVSVENQEAADKRIPLLLDTPAAVRFVSAEPLLGPVDLRAVKIREQGDTAARLDVLAPPWLDGPPDLPKTSIDWVIVGGESGSSARPCDITWIRAILEQCKAARVACFVKQLGAKPEHGHVSTWEEDGRTVSVRGVAYPEPGEIKNRKGGDPSEWPEDLRVRQFPRLGRTVPA